MIESITDGFGVSKEKGMIQLSPRERVLSALQHREADRVPIDLGSTISTIEVGAYEELKAFLGLQSKKTVTFLRDHVEPDPEILSRFEVDTRYIRIKPPKGWKLELAEDNSYLDEWGVRWKKPRSSLYWDPVEHPLQVADIKKLEDFPWPNPHDPEITAGLREKARYLFENTNFALVGDMIGLGVFETSWMLRGFQNFMSDLMLNPEFAEALLHKATDIKIGFYEEFLNAVGDYLQVVMTSDDMGSQSGLLISPQLYRSLIKPAHQRLWSFIKKRTKAKLLLHTCGSVYRLIPDFIELGVDILNPVQPLAKDMGTDRLKHEFGDKITFWGGIDTQVVLHAGTLEEVEGEVKRRIRDLAPGGGYIFSAAHNIQPGVKAENICRMYETALRYGVYPISFLCSIFK